MMMVMVMNVQFLKNNFFNPIDEKITVCLTGGQQMMKMMRFRFSD